ncbi:Putative transporter SVOPL [Chelonia mydas]|uniref:Putative transporter SVOPL n=1 Tax=Chelonia mydas TaxID=8469 RepID=M7AMQ0_CHEMY|nr:Putative transporter SVOPL [Chelonia mydas]
MAAQQKEVPNAIGLEEIGTERQEPKKEQKTFTVEEAVETIGFGRFHIVLFLVMGSTGVEAMEIMLIAVVSPLIRCEWQLNDWQVALVTTVVFFGYMIFSILFGLLADRYGRWKERRGRFCDLLDSKYLRTTLQIWIIWLGISFAYYGVILASAELLERDMVCSLQTAAAKELGNDSEESHSPCHCRLFAPSDYRIMIISTIGEIACLPYHNASSGDGDKWFTMSDWSYGGTIYSTMTFKAKSQGGNVYIVPSKSAL